MPRNIKGSWFIYKYMIYSGANIVFKVSLDENKQVNGAVYKYSNGSTNYGIFVKSLDGYKDRELNVVLAFYNTRGQMGGLETYKDGKLNGLQKKRLYTENDYLEREWYAKNGKNEGIVKLYYENGEILYYENGEINSIIIYKNNKSHNFAKWFYKSGYLNMMFSIEIIRRY